MLTPIHVPHRQTIDFTECTSLMCGVLLWCELICIISQLKRDVLEASEGGEVLYGKSWGRGGVQSAHCAIPGWGKCPVGPGLCACVCENVYLCLCVGATPVRRA